MNKTNLYKILLLATIVIFYLFDLYDDKVIGQTNSAPLFPSSNSTGCPQVQTDCVGEPFGCKSSFGIYDPKICMCVCPDSSSGGLNCSIDNDCPIGTCKGGKTYKNYSCNDGICSQIFYFADPCQVSTTSSSGGVSIGLSENFTGIWKAKVPRCNTPKPLSSTNNDNCIVCPQIEILCAIGFVRIPQSCTRCMHCERCKGLRTITLKFCVKDGKLTGSVIQGGIVKNIVLDTENVVSENEVELTVKDRNENAETLTLKLSEDGNLSGSFANAITFNAKKTTSFINCQSSSSSSSGEFKDCSSKGSCRGPNGTALSCPERTQCSGLPAYGCYPPGCPYPICLAPDTRIRTTGEQKRVADISKGALVLTDGEKPVRVIKTSKVEVKNHKILHIELNDGIILEISPGHPTADGRLFKDLKVGDRLDGRLVIETKLVQYNYKYTYDILPDSETGHYYANGVLIGSTLAGRK